MAVRQAVQIFPLIDPWASNGLPSPTLTNPDMILPFSDNRQSLTPSPPFHRPLSPPGVNSALNSHPPETALAAAMLRKKTPPPRNIWEYSDHQPADPLSDIEEADSTPRSRRPRSRSRSPSPSSYQTSTFSTWKRTSSQEQQRYSPDSGIGGNEDLGTWEGFDTPSIVEDSNSEVDLPGEDADAEDDRTSTGSTEFDDRDMQSVITMGEDEVSSAALSKRAERILANAKKRLTSMESKLGEARDSLLATPTSSKHESPFAVSIGEFAAGRGITRSVSQATGERRVIYNSGQSSGQRQSLYGSSTNMAGSRQSQVGFGGPLGIRSASALGASVAHLGFGSKDSLSEDSSPPAHEGGMPRRASTSQRNYPPLGAVRESDTPESLLDQDNSQHNYPQGLGISDLSSPTFGVSRSKSQSQMRDLRDQMNDLKGKISTLKARAKEDNIRRRSLQSLRTPSPFTAAEQWYTSAVEYREGGLNTNAGYGWSPKKEFADSPEEEEHSPTHPPNRPEADASVIASSSLEPKHNDLDAASAVETQYEDAEESPSGSEEYAHQVEPVSEGLAGSPMHSDEFEELRNEEFPASELENTIQEEYQDLGQEEVEAQEENEPEEEEFRDIEAVPAERHEDRADAFDYEHFFLHSALGNYSRSSRRSGRGSASSETSSVETTRALTPAADFGAFDPAVAQNNDISSASLKVPGIKPPPPRSHHRNDSVDSVSTLATFATATEGLDEDDEESDDAVLWRLQTATISGPPLVAIPDDRNGRAEEKSTSWPPRTSSRNRSHPNSRANSIYITKPHVQTAIQINGYPTPTTPKSRDSLASPETSPPRTVFGGKVLPATPSPQPTSHLVEALMSANPQQTLDLKSDDRELVERLVESLGKVCIQMGNDAGADVYDSKVWRRRLDAARRVLEGEIDIDQTIRAP